MSTKAQSQERKIVMCNPKDRGRPVNGSGCPEEEHEEKSLVDVLDRHKKIGQVMQTVGAKILQKVDKKLTDDVLDLDAVKTAITLMTTGVDIEFKIEALEKKFERLTDTREYIKTVMHILEKHLGREN